jgi:hypothetical protein
MGSPLPEVPEPDRAGGGVLVADRVEVGEVVADHAQGAGIGGEAGEAGVEGGV